MITLSYSCNDSVFILLFRIIRLQKNKLNLIVYRLQSSKLLFKRMKKVSNLKVIKSIFKACVNQNRTV